MHEQRSGPLRVRYVTPCAIRRQRTGISGQMPLVALDVGDLSVHLVQRPAFPGKAVVRELLGVAFQHLAE